MLHTKKLMGMHNKGTYTRVFIYAYTRIDIRVYAYRHTRICKIRVYNTRMRSSDISELHCSYITDLIKPYTPGRLLRSSNQFLLSTSKFNLKTYGGRSFTIAAPSVWNALPFELRSCNSLSSFKSKLKTWLFKIGYDVV